MTLEDPNLNIFANVTRDQFNTLRQSIVDMVLATDMRRHFEYLAKFQSGILATQQTVSSFDLFPWKLKDHFEVNKKLERSNICWFVALYIKWELYKLFCYITFLNLVSGLDIFVLIFQFFKAGFFYLLLRFFAFFQNLKNTFNSILIKF